MAFCAYCGKDVSPQARACPQCGHPTASAAGAPATGARGPVEPFAIASLASSIAGLTILPVIGAILGLAFGYAAKGRLARNPSLEGESLARAGRIIGWVGLAFGVFIVVAILAVVATNVDRGVIVHRTGRLIF
jgi:hypothetical protein